MVLARQRLLQSRVTGRYVVAKAKRVSQAQQWARLGAMARLQEIEQERQTILRVFPDLRRGRPADSPTGRGGRADVDALGRRRRTISPDGRKRMSEGMRKYWAKRKQAEKKEK